MNLHRERPRVAAEDLADGVGCRQRVDHVTLVLTHAVRMDHDARGSAPAGLVHDRANIGPTLQQPGRQVAREPVLGVAQVPARAR